MGLRDILPPPPPHYMERGPGVGIDDQLRNTLAVQPLLHFVNNRLQVGLQRIELGVYIYVGTGVAVQE